MQIGESRNRPQHSQRLRCLLRATMVVGFVISAGRTTAAANGDTATAPKAKETAVLSEIVITAQKRTGTVQTTPISITALAGGDIQSSGVTSAQGLAQLVPGMAIASGGPGQAIYEIRGLSAGGGEAPAVGFYLDEVSISPPLQSTNGKVEIDPDLYDLERVEVLRGPQGTLYGAGSMGGTIKLVTMPPQLRAFHASSESILSGTEGGGLNYAQKGMINIPLVSGKAALRVVGSYSHDSGYIDRIVVPNFPLETNPIPGYFGSTRGNVVGVPGSQVFRGVNDTYTTTARPSLLIEPTDNLSITAGVFYQNVRQRGINAYDNPPGTLAHYQPFDIAEPFSDTFTVYSLTANYDSDRFSVTSASGYWTRKSFQFQDGTEPTQNVFQFPSYYVQDGLGVGPAYSRETDNTRQFSQEVRIASRGDGNFTWLVGGYFSDFKESAFSGTFSPGFLTLPGAPFSTDVLANAYVTFHLTQEAGFANVAYKWRHLKVTLGGRYFSYAENNLFMTQGVLLTGSGAWQLQPLASAKASGILPLVNVSYTARKGLMLYASASKGYREGAGIIGFPLVGVVGEQCLAELRALGLNSVPTAYNPDTVWSYEAGEKGTLLGGRVTLNSDVYLTRWSHVQQFLSLPCGVGFTTNGPDAEVKGAEVELRANLTNFLSLRQSVGFSHAAFTSTLLEAGVVSGQELYDSPEWTVNTTLHFTRPISTKLDMFADFSNSYVSRSEELTYSLDRIPPRDITNVRLGIDMGRWEAALFVDNAFNQRKPIEYLNLYSFTGPPYDRIATNRPLTAGVDINFTF